MAWGMPSTQLKPGRQLHLGPSHEGALKIVDFPTVQDTDTAPRVAGSLLCDEPFDSLPDELILAILEFAILSFEVPHYPTARALTMACRRFNGLATPLLYKYLHFDLPFKPKSRALLRIDTSHLLHCRELHVRCSDMNGAMTNTDWQITGDFLTKCTKVRRLSIHGGYTRHGVELWPLTMNLLANMPVLQHLSLARQYWGLLLPRVKKYIVSTSLRHLSINGVSESKEAPRWKSMPASFTELRLSDYEEDAAATADLIKWPKNLRHFYFESFYNNRHHMDLAMFGSWLSSHKDTLEEIYIGYLSAFSKGTLIDVSEFSALNSLTLSRYSFSDDLESCAADASLLLAPGLETFTWSFSIYDQHCESWDAIGENEERWLRQFAEAAASKSIPLKRIHIIFDPDYWGYQVEDGYPWDRLDRVKVYSRQLNIELSYTKPALTKEEWLNHITEEKKMVEENTHHSGPPYSPSSIHDSEREGPQSRNSELTTEGRDIRGFFPPTRGTQLYDH
ncbi:hypothetical protein F4781DRAFT_70353 [Annulohypoxylon bovei var. microspora]|nr:hypothetical protein F4781DRAFT_70353 [Annulohypoxylon bovei var. microspora]